MSPLLAMMARAWLEERLGGGADARGRMGELQAQRDSLSNDDPAHAYLGPREHGAYAEARVRDRPLYGPVEQMALIPGYTLAKAAGLRSGRSEASVDEMAEGYRGVGRGVMANLGDLLTPAPVARPPATPPMSQLVAQAAQESGMDPQAAVQAWLMRQRPTQIAGLN